MKRLSARLALGAQPVAFDRLGCFAPLFQRVGEGEQVLSAFDAFGPVHLCAQKTQKLGQAHDVLAVVGEDALNGREIAVAQVAEIGLGHLGPGQVVLPGNVEKLRFQIAQRAAFQPQLPKPPGGIEDVGVEGGEGAAARRRCGR